MNTPNPATQHPFPAVTKHVARIRRVGDVMQRRELTDAMFAAAQRVMDEDWRAIEDITGRTLLSVNRDGTLRVR